MICIIKYYMDYGKWGLSGNNWYIFASIYVLKKFISIDTKFPKNLTQVHNAAKSEWLNYVFTIWEVIVFNFWYCSVQHIKNKNIPAIMSLQSLPKLSLNYWFLDYFINTVRLLCISKRSRREYIYYNKRMKEFLTTSS